MKTAETRQVAIEDLPLVAHGGQAEIYDYGDGKVLRVAKRPQDFDRIRYEYSVYSILAESGISVPRAYELVTVDGAPAIIMDKVAGSTMMSGIARNPLQLTTRARELARLHLGLREFNVASGLTPTKSKAEFCINHSQILSDHTKQTVLEVLKGLPDGDALCHGDFHPGNIICNGGKNYIIDWVGASRGDFHADMAHTYILLRVVPRVPHVSGIMHFMQKRVGRSMADHYLAGISSEISLDYEVFSKWVLINAAERTYHGLDSEQEHLQLFIGKYLEILAHGGNQAELYRAV